MENKNQLVNENQTSHNASSGTLRAAPNGDGQSGLSREAFLRRCETLFDAGLAAPYRLRLLDKWLDFVCRFEGGQMRYVADFIEDEATRTMRFSNGRTLANDADGYALVQFAAILTHPCQLCAEDLNAWWTRAAFCEHKRQDTNTSVADGTTQ